ncbi:MBL fold metallo-hydrolase [Patescibacteria group bacterium]|nr:MBL fold metallo-hydrolase [Patescibacteria group bacterium]
MDIFPLGHSSFRIKGKSVTVVTDPFDPVLVGFPFPKHISADIVTVTHPHKDHNNVSVVEGDPFVIRGPGEYEVKGVGIIGISSYHDEQKGKERGRNTLYHIETDGVNFVHLGDLGTMLSHEEIEKLDGVDILFVPVGGIFTITPEQAQTLISELEPSIVIPMHYKTDKHSKEFEEMASVQPFLKIMGKEDITPVLKLSITKEKLPSEMQIVVLE